MGTQRTRHLIEMYMVESDIIGYRKLIYAVVNAGIPLSAGAPTPSWATSLPSFQYHDQQQQDTDQHNDDGCRCVVFGLVADPLQPLLRTVQP